MTGPAPATTRTVDSVGQWLVSELRRSLDFDRFNIGFLDWEQYEFIDAFVHGQNVPGRRTGHRRTLRGTVVEAAVKAGSTRDTGESGDTGTGFSMGGDDREALVAAFPLFGPVFDSGIRAMMALPLGDSRQPQVALVLASTRADALDARALAEVRSKARPVAPRLIELASAYRESRAAPAGKRPPD